MINASKVHLLSPIHNHTPFVFAVKLSNNCLWTQLQAKQHEKVIKPFVQIVVDRT